MFYGSLCALVTPFDADDALDLRALEQLIDWHVACGTSALVLAGSTGESVALEDTELLTLWRMAVRHAAGRIKLIAGTGSPNTARSVRLTKMAQDCGVDAALVVTPAYVRPTQDGLYQHYEAIAKVGLPILLYNVPGRTACDLLPSTVERLLPLSNIIGIKEALPDMARIGALLALKQLRPDFLVLSGDDPTALDAMTMGADGVISVAANIVPASFRMLCASACGSDLLGGRALNKQLSPLYEALGLAPNPIVVKAALCKMGRIGPGIRLPLTPLDHPNAELLNATLAAILPHAQRVAA